MGKGALNEGRAQRPSTRGSVNATNDEQLGSNPGKRPLRATAATQCLRVETRTKGTKRRRSESDDDNNDDNDGDYCVQEGKGSDESDASDSDWNGTNQRHTKRKMTQTKAKKRKQINRVPTAEEKLALCNYKSRQWCSGDACCLFSSDQYRFAAELALGKAKGTKYVLYVLVYGEFLDINSTYLAMGAKNLRPPWCAGCFNRYMFSEGAIPLALGCVNMFETGSLLGRASGHLNHDFACTKCTYVLAGLGQNRPKGRAESHGKAHAKGKNRAKNYDDQCPVCGKTGPCGGAGPSRRHHSSSDQPDQVAGAVLAAATRQLTRSRREVTPIKQEAAPRPAPQRAAKQPKKATAKAKRVAAKTVPQQTRVRPVLESLEDAMLSKFARELGEEMRPEAMVATPVFLEASRGASDAFEEPLMKRVEEEEEVPESNIAKNAMASFLADNLSNEEDTTDGMLAPSVPVEDVFTDLVIESTAARSASPTESAHSSTHNTIDESSPMNVDCNRIVDPCQAPQNSPFVSVEFKDPFAGLQFQGLGGCTISAALGVYTS